MEIADVFIDTFWVVATQSVKIVVPVIAIWLIFKMIRNLVLGGR